MEFKKEMSLSSAASVNMRALMSEIELVAAFEMSKKMLDFRSDWVSFESEVEELAKRFVANNRKSGNFGALIDVFTSRQTELVQSVESDRFVQLSSVHLKLSSC